MKDHKYSINLGPWTGQGRRRRTMIYRIPNLEWKSHLNEPIKDRFNLALRAQKIGIEYFFGTWIVSEGNFYLFRITCEKWYVKFFFSVWYQI